MHLQAAAAPPEAVKIAATNLRRILALSATDRHVLRGASPSDLSLTAPHRVFALGQSDISADRPLDIAKQIGWRFLIEDKRRTIAGIELDFVDSTSQELQFARVMQGPFAPAMESAIRTAESSPDVLGQTYEFRLLRVPALYLEALWLRGPDPVTDILVPLAPTPRRFEAFHLYPAAAFLTVLRSAAEGRPAFDSSPRAAVSAG